MYVPPFSSTHLLLTDAISSSQFSAADLSSIARSLDTLEQGVMEGNLQASTNMDDTGQIF